MSFKKPIPRNTNALTAARDKFLIQSIGVRHGRNFDIDCVHTDSAKPNSGMPGNIMTIRGFYKLLGSVQGTYRIVIQKSHDGVWRAIDGELTYEVHTEVLNVASYRYGLTWSGDGTVKVFTHWGYDHDFECWEFIGHGWFDRTAKKLELN